MTPFPPIRPRFTALMWLVIALAVGFDAAYLWQRAGGAYDSEFGAHPDEAAHYVTGLFVRDAVTTLSRCLAQKTAAPLKAFGPEAPAGFYAHYPKVALGVWPPAFYTVQTAWTLLFGVSRTSVLMLMATIAGAVGVVMYRVVKAEFGLFAGCLAPFLWLSAPLVRMHYGMIMAEMLSTLTMFSATVFWGRYLDEKRMRDAVWFALFSAMAILTKGTGLALVLMVVFSMLLLRRWSILREKATWVAAALVGIIAGPWTWYFRKAGTQVGGWADNSGGLSVAFTMEAIPYYLRHLVLAMGIAVFGFALMGMAARSFGGGVRSGRWTALTSLVLAVFAFQCILPVGHEARHIISATPALVVLAMAGVVWMSQLPLFRSKISGEKSQAMWLVVLALLTFPVFAMKPVRKADGGFAPLAEWLVTQAPEARVLVCSDAMGEGMLISEIAMRDKRPGITIERGSKSLVDPKGRTWEGNNLRERFEDQALHDYLLSGKIDYIVLDSAVPVRRHASYHDQLGRVIEEHSADFWLVLDNPITRDGELMHRPLRLFRVKGANSQTSK